MPYEQILPPSLNQEFKANLKFAYPQEKAKDIAVQHDSTYNVIVTNTERISLRAKRKSNQKELAFAKDELESNHRLQKITSLPNLGVFSDEAHHTYGNEMDKELKRVRETVNPYK